MFRGGNEPQVRVSTLPESGVEVASPTAEKAVAPELARVTLLEVCKHCGVMSSFGSLTSMEGLLGRPGEIRHVLSRVGSEIGDSG